MKILSRYIVLELAASFIVTLVTMTMFVMIFLVGDEAIDKGLGMSAVLRTVPYFLPQAMALTVPGSMLLATTIVYGRVAASNEVVALKALGGSPLVLVWPTMGLAVAASVGAVWLNDMAVSWGREGVERVFFESLEQIAYGRLQSVGSFTLGEWEVNVQAVDDQILVHPVVRKSTPEGGGPVARRRRRRRGACRPRAEGGRLPAAERRGGDRRAGLQSPGDDRAGGFVR